MANATINISYQMSDDKFLDIVDAAGYGIAYWARRAMLHRGTYVVTASDGEGDLAKEYTLTAEDYTRAVLQVLTEEGSSKHLKKACMDLVINEDDADIDATHADLLTQIACFGEVVYG